MKTAIDVQSVSKEYGHIQALDSISLTIQEGEIYGLLGSNGAGKTTLIKILVGALKYDSGTVSVLGLEPTANKRELRPQIGYMPQQSALYEDLTARENVRFFGRARRIPEIEKRINEVLDFLDLKERKDDPVYAFSGGMKQRVSLACALVHRPRLLLLDEPSTGIDLKLREMLWKYFRQLTAQGTTIVVSTHQMDEALHCDRVVVMRRGQVLAEDRPAELMQRGGASVSLHRAGKWEEHQLKKYREELPALLGISSEIDQVEIRVDTLEDIILRLITEGQAQHD